MRSEQAVAALEGALVRRGLLSGGEEALPTQRGGAATVDEDALLAWSPVRGGRLLVGGSQEAPNREVPSEGGGCEDGVSVAAEAGRDYGALGNLVCVRVHTCLLAVVGWFFSYEHRRFLVCVPLQSTPYIFLLMFIINMYVEGIRMVAAAGGAQIQTD